MDYAEEQKITLAKYPLNQFRYEANLIEIDCKDKRPHSWEGTYSFSWFVYNNANECVAEVLRNLSDGEHSYYGDECSLYDEDGNVLVRQRVSFDEYFEREGGGQYYVKPTHN